MSPDKLIGIWLIIGLLLMDLGVFCISRSWGFIVAGVFACMIAGAIAVNHSGKDRK